ncbi:type II toxin-antitoxin system RelE/ParE family toxin [uncultured Roseivirga sp.]|uniref:type II toxin-antitoxin system RelE/ParE family toxin n=1 Tax=uncultured Roseivirga sp. TaxID=543088 RepID=UPI000D7979BF|nr:type II toxin-antitoxin system RelE/ParE family toxin [uncultured Roseivirga sp.]PWL28531.1 MAG: plasmid stabilization protein [Roseivirga sp. XM-24bin3]
MALEIVWTTRAINGFEEIIEYLETHFTEREVRNFVRDTNEFFELLKEYPELLERTGKPSNVFRGALNKYTILTYRLKPRKGQIGLINIRAARKKPLEK